MTNYKQMLVSGVLAVACVSSLHGESSSESTAESVRFMKSLLTREELSREARSKELEAHLKTLERDAYLSFLRSVGKTDDIFEGDEDRQVSMFFFARWFLEKFEEDGTQRNLALLQDQSLPWRWRWALLDILKPEKNRELKMSEMTAITKILRTTSKAEAENENLRYSCIEKNASLLISQLELVGEEVPSLKVRVTARDRTVVDERMLQNKPELGARMASLLNEVDLYELNLEYICKNAESQKLRTRAKAVQTEWQEYGSR